MSEKKDDKNGLNDLVSYICDMFSYYTNVGLIE